VEAIAFPLLRKNDPVMPVAYTRREDATDRHTDMDGPRMCSSHRPECEEPKQLKLLTVCYSMPD